MKRRGFFAVLFGSIAAAFSKPADMGVEFPDRDEDVTSGYCWVENPEYQDADIEYDGVYMYLKPGKEEEGTLWKWEIDPHPSRYFWDGEKLIKLP